MNTNVKAFILENWDKTVRTNTADEGDLIGLPKPYTVPCIEGTFQECIIGIPILRISVCCYRERLNRQSIIRKI